MAFAVFAQFLEDRETDSTLAFGEHEFGEGVPKVFAEGGGNGFFAIVRDLGEGGIILAKISIGAQLSMIGKIHDTHLTLL